MRYDTISRLNFISVRLVFGLNRQSDKAQMLCLLVRIAVDEMWDPASAESKHEQRWESTVYFRELTPVNPEEGCCGRGQVSLTRSSSYEV